MSSATPQWRMEKVCRKCCKDTSMDRAGLNVMGWKDYQNNRYNWKEHIVPMPNSVWEMALARVEGQCKRHVFRQENGVWGVNPKKMKDVSVIQVKAAPLTGDAKVLVEVAN
eukprot:Phypoly_transcript_14755.p2 GENE.Phypoly_transcript_14755~~Phypoly_transcript_14755.p2  ORF type:complete len:111 (+),score=14.98 Phypoly_transcript_14755:621-953(+)